LMALAARSPARLAAGLAAGQLGWLLAGLSSHHQPSAGAAIYLLGAYAVALAGIPRAAGAGLRAPFRASAGLGGRDPARALALTLGMLSLAGMPPLGGWFGEFAVAAQLAPVGHLWLFGLGLVQFLAGSIGALRLAGLVYLSPPPEEAARVERHPLATASAATLAVFLLAYGVFANPVDGLALQGAAALGLR
ncbi:MAG: proton-conducting transporter membrane subunit, partial [Candidatus Dormibacterales bacterium]